MIACLFITIYYSSLWRNLHHHHHQCTKYAEEWYFKEKTIPQNMSYSGRKTNKVLIFTRCKAIRWLNGKKTYTHMKTAEDDNAL